MSKIIVKGRNVAIKGKGGRIGATITFADKDKTSPIVVIIGDNGATDRDGNANHFHTDLYRNFAALFASYGCLCVRYDKHGSYETEGDASVVSLDDYVNDVISVVEYMKTLPYADRDCVLLFGHGEGCIVATLAAQKIDVQGMVLVGGAGNCLKDMLYYQNRMAVENYRSKKGLIGLLGRIGVSQEKARYEVERFFERAAKKDAPPQTEFSTSGGYFSTAWVKQHGELTSSALVDMIEAYGKPVLAITGTADLSADYNFLEAFKGMKHVQIYTPANVNHQLRELDSPNDFFNSQLQYVRLATQPIHDGTEDVLYDWFSMFTGGEAVYEADEETLRAMSGAVPEAPGASSVGKAAEGEEKPADQ